ncbi:mechanosensitive ion channel family protein [Rubritalea marina]|uniref:mechanosensitive ion channel family protein n=1 Tax=Rubritalea marina TaxID=361055 RepID=UPI00035D9906|nr:mechanosensitive ion channel family protein [Rubritalea marina]
MFARDLHNWLFEMLYSGQDSAGAQEHLIVNIIMLVIVLLISVVSYYVVRSVLYGVTARFVKMTKNDWDDEVMKSRLLRWISLLVPVFIIWSGAQAMAEMSVDGDAESLKYLAGSGEILMVVSQISAISLVLLAVMSCLNIVERIYGRYEISRKIPVKSFIQVFKVVFSILGIILMVSSVIGKSPVFILSGLGAATAILMLVFKDAILGLVAGVQLSANQMVSVGDWIEMPKFGADGEVTEVALTTVKVCNWDKTITTVPTYALISDSFKNWRGMSDSGVRRIKRSINLDMQTVHPLSESEIEKMETIHLLTEYLGQKKKEIAAWNGERQVGPEELVNARALTNVGTFRAYVVAYLKSHPKIAQDQTILVRHLTPSDKGLPIEIYAFSTDNAWVNFEGIQSDIFDHLMAVIPEFGLKVYQAPSGDDIKGLGGPLATLG